MSTKPKLYYFNGRGKMESIRWLLAAAGVEFEEEFLETREQYEKLLQGGSLLFQQVPMVEIDGMRMVQTKAILSYIAAKYNLYGKDLKERALIDMYVGGTDDLMGFILMFPFLSAEDKEKQRALIVQKATSRYFPVYEKVLKDHGQDFLVGNNFSWADVHLLEAILMVEEKKSDVLSGFPQLQYLSGNQELRIMSGKPRLTYLNGRGRMEPIRWLLAAAGVEFEEVYLETKEQYDKLIKDGFLLFQQVPLVEIDGMKMVQTRAIMSYIAGKYNLYGKDLKERALIDMYVEGISDLMQMILMFPFSPPDAKEKNLESIKERATNRYFPVFEKVLKQHGQDFLVGNKFSWADVQLMEAILAVEEKVPDVLSGFPQLKVFKTKMSNMPTIKKFLQPGSPRKPPPDAHYVETVLKVFKK
ncbi:glutathione S-transferase isoform X1 [Passer montanus]|uniref:glutathione S-transferase isoform X1 n=2 Tax=Passer TaxID=9159 RepID=UPI00196027D7|nr:glutathione S-transferase isoform X1 [Passer montanus]XP_039583011.1 glutathione S-transferase isoform X1 [Passer montanus]XP_039583018.1 glutathione S-transferase isoform X1 [Passer montanus]